MAAKPGDPTTSAGTGPQGRRGPRLTAERVVDGALELTREHGLDGWTIRQLAQELGTWPNTIAYHVGDREAVVDAVVQRVVATMPIPPADRSWQDWFRDLLFPSRALLARYPGVARRLARDGATVPAALPIMDRGIGLLTDAGFGEQAPVAYGVLLNTAVLLVALDDDRRLHGYGDRAAALLAMDPPPEAGAGWATLLTWLHGWSEESDTPREAMFRHTIEVLLTGLEADRIGAQTGSGAAHGISSNPTGR
ncbi:TetR/AcrR family transcriptional regulator C-terminal domain-containing protein [Streptomyces sp. SM11]|uniref:TetR/AcrR family transcriptional regulator C-terminal domain-containing protein n=1 Tax=Streptomyces sp. SM11 TaxID=565557 RepID=UPI000CD51D88|nr:TetR/AcrR family transcriptional regulator C-terminal domain-containing protein [Streptomyces sp. SM11]